MVAQQEQSKTSSGGKKVKRGYDFHSVVITDWRLPKEPVLGSVLQQNLAGGLSGYVILADPGNMTVNPLRWKTPPHRYFVNLPASITPELGLGIVDPNALLGFSRRYGFLSHKTVKDRWVLDVESSASLDFITSEVGRYTQGEFRELIENKSQGLMQYAWITGDARAVQEFAKYAAGNLQYQVEIDVDTGEAVVKVVNAWTLICMLFVRDHAAGKTAICANPDCPARYFLKSRKTQKICEAGDCVEWAQRNYALRWWRENKRKNREEDAK
jgi:hypothetical protein